MASLHSRPIEGFSSPYYADFAAAYEFSFPPSERRTRAAQAAAFADPRYRLECWRDQGAFIGFMGWWDFGAYRYIEHVAVAPGARSGGYGSRILLTWRDADPRPVYLEIEEPRDELTRRRLAFYQRLDFVENPGVHMQPFYQPGADGEQEDASGVPMQALSWPGRLSSKEHKEFLHTLRSVVWARLDG